MASEHGDTETEQPGGGFAGLGLGETTLRGVSAAGFDRPTPIQAAAIPILARGADLVAQSQTGTGKTAAFGLPLIERIDPALARPQALIVCPTRELAVQVAGAVETLARGRKLRVTALYGGAPIGPQFVALRHGPHVIVGTPGRLLDHLRRESLVPGDIRTVVIDEADELLNMGFLEDLEALLAALPEDRQTSLFSATLPPPIVSLARRYLREPEQLRMGAEAENTPQIRQWAVETTVPRRLETLCRLLDAEQPAAGILFCRTRRETEEIGEALRGEGFPAESLHGDMAQAERERVLGRFRAGHVALLVATDVAARGLDIESVTHVVNFEVPRDGEIYTHRIGRTGRAGRQGDAITLVTPHERRRLRGIAMALRVHIAQYVLPTPAELLARRRDAFAERLRAAAATPAAPAFAEFTARLGAEVGVEALATALVRALWENHHPGAPLPAWGPPPRPEPAPAPPGERPREEPPGRRRTHKGRDSRQVLFLTVGKRAGLRPRALVEAMVEACGIPEADIGTIELRDDGSFVVVPGEWAARVARGLSRGRLCGRTVTVGPVDDTPDEVAERVNGPRPPAPPPGKKRKKPR